MALTHTISGIRQYLSKYLLDIAVIDTVTGAIYNRQFSLPSSPDSGEQDARAALAKTRIQKELDYVANPLNLREDQEKMLEHVDGIYRHLITSIRANHLLALSTVQAYVANNYPNSIIDFANLYQFWLDRINVSTWDEFKTFVLDHEFREID